MSDRKPVVAMTASGRVKEYVSGSSVKEVLESIRSDHMRASSGWDRPVKLFIGGECVISEKLTDIAWDYGEFYEKACDKLEAELEAWIEKRTGIKSESEGA